VLNRSAVYVDDFSEIIYERSSLTRHDQDLIGRSKIRQASLSKTARKSPLIFLPPHFFAILFFWHLP
ncbi:MAG: hypothetical protein ACKOOI_06390, partial [Pirellula sp.]